MLCFLRIEDLVAQPQIIKSLASDKGVKFYQMTDEYDMQFTSVCRSLGADVLSDNVYDASVLYPNAQSLKMIMRGDDQNFMASYHDYLLNNLDPIKSIVELMVSSFYEINKCIILVSSKDIQQKIPSVFLKILLDRYGFNHITQEMLEKDLSIILTNPVEFNIIDDINVLLADVDMMHKRYPKEFPTSDEVAARYNESLAYATSQRMASDMNNVNNYGMGNIVPTETIKNPLSALDNKHVV